MASAAAFGLRLLPSLQLAAHPEMYRCRGPSQQGRAVHGVGDVGSDHDGDVARVTLPSRRTMCVVRLTYPVGSRAPRLYR
jgi:hypothetical protein